MEVSRRCKAKSKRSQSQCKRQAVEGREVCYMHGGASVAAGPGHHLWKHGQYSKVVDKMRSRIPEITENWQALKNSEELDDINDEAAISRILWQMAITEWGDSAFTVKYAPIMSSLIESASKTIERRYKLLHSDSVALNIEEFKSFLSRLASIVKDVYGDNERYVEFCQRIAGELRSTGILSAGSSNQSAEDS